MEHHSSDEEDVFSCGRCKHQFSSMDSFMVHKASGVCHKIKQHHTNQQQLPPEITSDLPVLEHIPESMQGTFQKVPSLSASPASLQISSATSDYNLQSSVNRLQHDFEVFQEGQQVDFSSSQSQSSIGMIPLTSDVFEELLGSPDEELPTTSVGKAMLSRGSYIDKLASHEMQRAYSDCLATSKASQNDEVTSGDEFRQEGSQGESQTSDELIQRQLMKQKPETIVLGSENFLEQENQNKAAQGNVGTGSSQTQNVSKVSRRKTNETQKETTTKTTQLKIPEACKSSKPVVCKFCSETLKNTEFLFRHYIDTHKMKNTAALEFLRQVAFKRGRGRPPKGLTLRTPKNVTCPHCNESFNNKNLCATHIKKRHQKHQTSELVAPSSPSQSLPTGRMIKCSRCSFQTTTVKDFTAHIHDCQCNDRGDEAVSEKSEENTDSSSVQLKDKPKSRRRRKSSRSIQKDAVNLIQDDEVEIDDEEEQEKDEIEEGDEENNSTSKGLVRCPECNKKMSSRGLKRHQIRCTNKNRFVCPLCQHKSRESYDHTVHVDNHRTWVKAQPNWLNGADLRQLQSGPSSVTLVSSSMSASNGTPPLISIDSNQVDIDKEFASTVDLDELALITQIQGDSDLLRTSHNLLGGGDAGQDLQAALIDGSLLPKDSHDEGNAQLLTQEEQKVIDGGDRKINPRDLKCKICYTWFGRTSLPKHMLQAHNRVKRFQCREFTCQNIFGKLEEFKAHIATHDKQDMFHCGCRSCMNRRLVNTESLDNMRKEKMREYYKHMSHKCSKCWVKFPSTGSLDRHMKTESHHHPCSKCGKIQVSKRQLRMHMVTHQDERCFLCEVCGRNFKTKRDLNKHTYSHNNVRPFQCPECTKCFSFKNKMTRHMVTVHSVKKPFMCEWSGCERGFSRKDKLHDHAKTHLVSQQLKCQHCGKGFCRKDNLKDHEILHTREFRFRCEICNRGFMRPKILERHCMTEHPTCTLAPQVTLQATISQDGSPDTTSQHISYVLCEPNYVYANIEQLTSFHDNVQDADLMQGQRATIEAFQHNPAAVIENGTNQFQMAGTDGFPVNITLGT
ncbi:uncharacterized protein [Asterias amurensis]|uniref:uncharacterized protein n=1 Tax=Asterias amurensis TaxID=7602 RepID=UPI003AB11595